MSCTTMPCDRCNTRIPDHHDRSPNYCDSCGAFLSLNRDWDEADCEGCLPGVRATTVIEWHDAVFDHLCRSVVCDTHAAELAAGLRIEFGQEPVIRRLP